VRCAAANYSRASAVRNSAEVPIAGNDGSDRSHAPAYAHFQLFIAPITLAQTLLCRRKRAQ
jgi:hypothetical protein